MNLVNALPIHIIKNLANSKMLASSSSSTPMDPAQISQYTEIVNALVEKLPEEILPYFEQLISGDKIDKSILQTIREMCHVILRDMGYDTGF
jgi:GTPase Era involved in 16S rRNA processing